jgi:uncharacterized protein (DUF2236 family)
MQACHPLALAGVQQHSAFRADPLLRLQRTNRYVTTSTFGTTQLAEQEAASVTQVHERVAGVADDGRPYSAMDPHLLLWVHLGLTESMLVAFERFGESTVDGDEYVRDMSRLALALGVHDPPLSRADLTAAIAEFRTELRGGPATRSIGKFLRFPGAALPIGAWAPYEVLVRSASDLLPLWAHRCLGGRPRHSLMQKADASACQLLLRSMRTVVGQHSPAVQLAHRRVGHMLSESGSGVDHH